MAASEGQEATAAVELEGEAPGRNIIGVLHGRYEGEAAIFLDKTTDDGRIAVVAKAEAADVARVGDEAAPSLAGERGEREGGRSPGEA
jgi:hypothetical protein